MRPAANESTHPSRLHDLSERPPPALESINGYFSYAMADVTTNLPPASSALPVPAIRIGGPDDPLASLHKMSMTAGLGSQDYVAINNVAIVGLIFGFAGALALIKPLLLLIPAAGLVCAIVAWFQIRNSNGTQSGKMIVAFALLLCLGIGGFVLARTAGAAIEQKSDEDQIGQLITQFGQNVASHDYDHAYSQCSDEFRKRVSQGKFVDTFQTQEHLGGMGGIKSMAWNGADDWFGATADGQPIAVALTLISFEKAPEPYRQNVSFIKVEDQSGSHWQVDDIPSLFPKPRKSSGAGPMPTPGEPAPEGPSLPQ
jgi:hypothetical protein